MLEKNSFLLAKIGSQCGKCLEEGKLSDSKKITYLVDVLRDYGDRFGDTTKRP
tara:strand:- start:184 stop:342 length:159 start_codon:yes stop_codon:yes gene_type:complete